MSSILKIGRNDPCPCGSGIKYKKCCLNEDIGEIIDDSSLEPFTYLNQITEKFPDQSVEVIQAEEKGIIKMSEIILEYVDDLLNSVSDDHRHQQEEDAIRLGIMSWNLALLDESELNQRMTELKEHAAGNEGRYIMDILQTLIRRKHKHYPHINRYILDYEFKIKSGGFNLNILAVAPPSEK